MMTKEMFEIPERQSDFWAEIAGVEISASIYFQPHDLPEVTVIEDDTCMVLNADPEFIEPRESLWNIRTKISRSPPYPVGSLVTIANNPLRLAALVYDLNQSPICTLDGITSALKQILHFIDERQLKSMVMPVLGAKYGNISFYQFIAMLTSELTNNRPTKLSYIALKLH